MNKYPVDIANQKFDKLMEWFCLIITTIYLLLTYFFSKWLIRLGLPDYIVIYLVALPLSFTPGLFYTYIQSLTRNFLDSKFREDSHVKDAG